MHLWCYTLCLDASLVMYVVYVYVLCCVVLYIGCRCMCYMSSVDACVAWCGMPCVVICVGCTLCVCAHG